MFSPRELPRDIPRVGCHGNPRKGPQDPAGCDTGTRGNPPWELPREPVHLFEYSSISNSVNHRRPRVSRGKEANRERGCPFAHEATGTANDAPSHLYHEVLEGWMGHHGMSVSAHGVQVKKVPGERLREYINVCARCAHPRPIHIIYHGIFHTKPPCLTLTPCNSLTHSRQ